MVTDPGRERASGLITMLDAGGPNSVAMSTGIAGDEWTLWIVQMGLRGVTQYNEWLRLGPISSTVLTSRLNRLVATGVMDRVAYHCHPPRHDYLLTKRGQQMWPILLSMWAWELAWVNDPHHHLPEMRHIRCGAIFTPVLVCDACDAEVTVRDVNGRVGPSGGPQRSAPAGAHRRRRRPGSRPAEIVDQTMALIGNRWSTAMLGAAFSGAHRFGEFERGMGAPPTIVAERLRTFCQIGVLTRSPNRQRPDWALYHLTDKGRAFFPVVASVLEWGQRWFQSPEGPALEVQHPRCGHSFHPRLRCSECHQRMRGSTVEVVRADPATIVDGGRHVM